MQTIIVLAVVSIGIVGCKEDKGNRSQTTPTIPAKQNLPEFSLDYTNSDSPQILKSELFLRSISIKQYHIEQEQPIYYYANDISKIIFHHGMHTETEEWGLNQIDIHLKDGTVKTEHPIKVWNVQLDMTFGNGNEPVPIEQHFTPYH